MTAEQQLERSVLESKERDELHAIAQALSVKTTTRTKKADIIDGILKATARGPRSPRPPAPPARRGPARAAADDGDGAQAPAGGRRRRPTAPSPRLLDRTAVRPAVVRPR